MRILLPFAVLLAACSRESGAPDLADGTYAGPGRNRLCVANTDQGRRAGVIVYGKEAANCAASGRLEGDGSALFLIPKGEGGCRIELRVSAGSIQLGPVPTACAYYCGPGVGLEGAKFSDTRSPDEARDHAGEPLC